MNETLIPEVCQDFLHLKMYDLWSQLVCDFLVGMKTP